MMRLAAGLSDLDEQTLYERQGAARVRISCDPSLPGAVRTLRLLLTTLRRLPT
jgi:hypothetical protein